MRLTTADLWESAPGTVLRWDVVPTGRPAPAALSLNQRNHLAAAASGEAAVWLAAAFDVDGPIDTVALGRAWDALVARHDSLQLEALPGDGAAAARRHDPAALRWSVTTEAMPQTPGETGATLRALLDRHCAPLRGYPAFAPLAVSRADRSTVVLGMDHLHCDAYSVAVVVDELATLYDAVRHDRARPLPTVATGVSGDIAPVPPDDERIGGWHDFLEARDFTLPTWPLPLGVPSGARLPQASTVGRLASADRLEALGARARAVGVSTYAVVLASLAAALHDLGGPERLDTLVPVQTRAGESGRTVGWHTTTVPVSVRADVSDAGLAAAGAAVRNGVRLGAVPLDQVLGSLPRPLVQTRRDVFMVSWIDYRHLPGADRAAERAATHVSASTLADDVQLWLARTDAGLSLRTRFPDTPEARRGLESVLKTWAARLGAVG